MKLIKKLFGPSLDELVELELQLKHKKDILPKMESVNIAEAMNKTMEIPKELSPYQDFLKMNMENRIECFYKSLFHKISDAESITTKLIACNSEESQSNLAFKSIYDKVILDYDFDKGAYIVADEYSETLGRLSRSVSEKINQKESDYELLGFIKSVDINIETDKYTADIIIYFV